MKEYRMILSNEQLNFFNTNGYLVIPNFISPTMCDQLKKQMDYLLQINKEAIPQTVFSADTNEHAKHRYFMDSGNKIHFFFEPGSFDDDGNHTRPFELALNKVGHALHELDPIFRAFSHDARIGQLCQQLGMNKIGLLQSMYIFKQPGIGAEVTCHQDSTYVFGQDSDALGFWFALEDATVHNGCLEVIPSPITTTLKKRMKREGDNIYFEDYDTTPFAEENSIPLPASKGTLVILHGRLPHKSKANTSNQSRHAYTLHMVDLTSPYPSENWIQWPEGIPQLESHL